MFRPHDSSESNQADSESSQADEVNGLSSLNSSNESARLKQVSDIHEFARYFAQASAGNAKKTRGISASGSSATTMVALATSENMQGADNIVPAIAFAKIKRVDGSGVTIDSDDQMFESRSDTPHESPREGGIHRSKSFSDITQDEDGHYRPGF